MSGALALRGGFQVAKLLAASKYGRLAMRAGRTYSKYKPAMRSMAFKGAGRGARYALNKFNSRKRRKTGGNFSRQRIGNNVGKSNAKRVVQFSTGLAPFNTRILNERRLTTTTKGTQLDARERGLVNIRGFKICMELENLGEKPLYFNYAVIYPKACIAEDLIEANNFFRSSGNERGADFGDALTSNEFHCLPINTDKFVILKHKRMVVPGANTNSGRTYRNIDFYCKLNRQMRYDDFDATSPEGGHVFLVFWMDVFGTTGGTAPQTGQCAISERIITYFRETKP